MTIEEAIKELKIEFVGEYDRQREAKNIAIKALERVLCEDVISRQAVLDMATTIETDDYSGNELLEVVDIDDIKELPSVTLA